MESTIQHLVISGGANIGFVFFGILKEFMKKSFFTMDQIKSIYSTSVGCIVSVCICLGYDFEDIETFFLERPWENIYKIDFHCIIRAIQNGGMFDKNIIVETLKPLFLGKDLSLDITLEEFHAYCQKDLHFFVTKYSSLELVDISHHTHPEWKVIDAVYASSCLPVLFEPFEHSGDYYIDGGVLKNYPLIQCIENGCDPNTILGIYHECTELNESLKNSLPFQNGTKYRLLEFLLSFMFKMWTIVKHGKTVEESNIQHKIGVICNTDPQSMLEAFLSKDERHRLFQNGIDQATIFLEEHKGSQKN